MKTVAPGIPPVLAVDRASETPLYRQLYEGYREAIVERRSAGGPAAPFDPWARRRARDLAHPRAPGLRAAPGRGLLREPVGRGNLRRRELPAGRADAGPAARWRRRAAAAPGRRGVSRAPECCGASRSPGSGGWGAFRVSQPAVDRFPFQVWSSLVARHSRNPPGACCLWRPDGLPALPRGHRRLPAHGARGALRGGADHGGQRLPAGARPRRPRAARPGRPGLGRGAGLPRRAGRADRGRRPAGAGAGGRRGAGRGGRHRALRRGARPPTSRRRTNTRSA